MKSCWQAFERERKSWSGLIWIRGRGLFGSGFLALREIFEELLDPELFFAIGDSPSADNGTLTLITPPNGLKSMSGVLIP